MGSLNAAPLLVGVHGWLLSGRLWEPLTQALEPRWDCWTPDLPGFGQRPRPKELRTNLVSYGRWLAEAARRAARGPQAPRVPFVWDDPRDYSTLFP